MRFEIGDRVACANCYSIECFVTPRKVYRVEEIKKYQGLNYIRIVDDNGNWHYLRENRFYKSFRQE